MLICIPYYSGNNSLFTGPLTIQTCMISSLWVWGCNGSKKHICTMLPKINCYCWNWCPFWQALWFLGRGRSVKAHQKWESLGLFPPLIPTITVIRVVFGQMSHQFHIPDGKKEWQLVLYFRVSVSGKYQANYFGLFPKLVCFPKTLSFLLSQSHCFSESRSLWYKMWM